MDAAGVHPVKTGGNVANLQDFKDDLAKEVHGWEKPKPGYKYSVGIDIASGSGQREYRISGMCEYCFDDLFSDDSAEEAIKPDLLPCPFCGSEDSEFGNLVDEDDYFVSCNGCQIQQIANHTPEEAVSKWNTRVETKESKS